LIKMRKIILDTDMGSDCDDAGALSVLHRLADEKKAEILAVTYCSTEIHGAVALKAINSWFGRGDILVGRMDKGTFLEDAPFKRFTKPMLKHEVISSTKSMCTRMGFESGMSITIVAGVQAAIASLYAIKNKDFSIPEKIIFLIAYIVCGVSNIKNIYDILPFIAAMLCMVTLLQKNEQKIRIFNITNSIVWIIYDFIVGSTAFYTQLLFLSINAASLIAYKFKGVNVNDKR